MKSLVNLVTISLLTASLFLVSCFSEQSGKPRSTGKTNVILVVTNTKAQWEGDLGTQLREYFGTELGGLPQPEPMFSFYNIALKDFNKVYKKFHNIFIIDINPEWNEPLVETKTNLWSWPQRIIKITAPDEQSFSSVFEEQKEAYLRLFDKMERERTINSFQMANDISISNRLMRDFELYLAVPGGFSVAKQEQDFIWMRHTVQKLKQDVELGIMIYTSEYSDTVAFSPDQIISRRNEITRKYISGPTKGSTMKVADRFVKPIFKLADDFVVDYAVETRGLWDVTNDFMGGPFISYTFVDEKTNRLITLDGYIYYPNELKRNYIRQLESIFHTLKLQS